MEGKLTFSATRPALSKAAKANGFYALFHESLGRSLPSAPVKHGVFILPAQSRSLGKWTL
jgi:hypothetical protein